MTKMFYLIFGSIVIIANAKINCRIKLFNFDPLYREDHKLKTLLSL